MVKSLSSHHVYSHVAIEYHVHMVRGKQASRHAAMAMGGATVICVTVQCGPEIESYLVCIPTACV